MHKPFNKEINMDPDVSNIFVIRILLYFFVFGGAQGTT